MNVILRMLRYVVVDDVAYVGNIQTACGNISSDKDFIAAVAKTAERLLAFTLGPIRMQDRNRMVRAFEQMRNPIRTIFRPTKDNHRIIVDALKQLEQQVGFLGVRNGINHMFYRFSRCAARPDLDCLRSTHRPLDKGLYLRRNSRRKKGRVPRTRALLNDPAHIGQKAHVEHSVRFIEDEESNAVEPAGPLVEQIEQAPWGGY